MTNKNIKIDPEKNNRLYLVKKKEKNSNFTNMILADLGTLILGKFFNLLSELGIGIYKNDCQIKDFQRV